jgi:serine protease AprX
MAGTIVLVEILQPSDEPFQAFAAAAESEQASGAQAERLLADLSGMGIEVTDAPPVPMFVESEGELRAGLESMRAAMAPRRRRGQGRAGSLVVEAEVARGRLEELRERKGVKLWPSSELVLYAPAHAYDLASSRGGIDCRPFRDAVEVERIRELLTVRAAWNEGFRGQNVVVGIIDDGVNGEVYPVTGGFSRRDSARQPGAAPITSHGSMCAADVLVAAPAARLYDYPFLGVPRSGGALVMFQAVLEQRRRDGTPHLTNNSYGFVGVPDPASNPDHEIHNPNHPLHRKIREVVAAGVTCVFAAGNCGVPCPSGQCHPSGTGPERSVHASHSLAEVITVAAVNAHHERIGYSSQGPGMFEAQKPDVAAYSHFFGNFGPGRPGGTAQPFDNGTSAASPVAAGVAALLLSAFPQAGPDTLKRTLIETACQIGRDIGWNRDYGHGIINAGMAYTALRHGAVPTS